MLQIGKPCAIYLHLGLIVIVMSLPPIAIAYSIISIASADPIRGVSIMHCEVPPKKDCTAFFFWDRGDIGSFLPRTIFLGVSYWGVAKIPHKKVVEPRLVTEPELNTTSIKSWENHAKSMIFSVNAHDYGHNHRSIQDKIMLQPEQNHRNKWQNHKWGIKISFNLECI